MMFSFFKRSIPTDPGKKKPEIRKISAAERISQHFFTMSSITPSGVAEKASQGLSKINGNTALDMSKLEELAKKLSERDSQIQRDKKLWEATFNSIPDLIVIVDKDRRIIRANYSFCKKTGLTEQQYQNMKCHDLLVGSTHPCSFCPATYKSGSESTCYKIHEDIKLRVEKVDINNQYLKGTFLFSSTEILDDDEQINSVLVLRDISEFKEGI